MTTNLIPLSKQVNDMLLARKDEVQWEAFILAMLKKLELPDEERAKAIKKYEELAEHIAKNLHVDETHVHVVIQGSMRTQTTTAMFGTTKFDLDIVVKLSSEKYRAMTQSQQFFDEFGAALKASKGQTNLRR